jgi:hypothetical protein
MPVTTLAQLVHEAEAHDRASLRAARRAAMANRLQDILRRADLVDAAHYDADDVPVLALDGYAFWMGHPGLNDRPMLPWLLLGGPICSACGGHDAERLTSPETETRDSMVIRCARDIRDLMTRWRQPGYRCQRCARD